MRECIVVLSVALSNFCFVHTSRIPQTGPAGYDTSKICSRNPQRSLDTSLAARIRALGSPPRPISRTHRGHKPTLSVASYVPSAFRACSSGHTSLGKDKAIRVW